MASLDLEKDAHPLAVNEAPQIQTSLQDDLSSRGRIVDPEKQGDLLRPLSPWQVGQLTTSVTRRSQNSAKLTPSRSFADARSGYFSGGDDSDEPVGDNNTVERKEFEVAWDGPDDPMNPKNMHVARKWLVVMTLGMGSLCVTCTSSLYTTIYDQTDVEFHCSRVVATLGLALFVWGLGLSPMILAPLSEFYGRRPIYIGSFIFFTIWLVPCGESSKTPFSMIFPSKSFPRTALAKNIATMLIARFLDGLAGSAFLSVAGGSIGDMFTREHLQAPMMIYTTSPFIGPGIGPIIGTSEVHIALAFLPLLDVLFLPPERSWS